MDTALVILPFLIKSACWDLQRAWRRALRWCLWTLDTGGRQMLTQHSLTYSHWSTHFISQLCDGLQGSHTPTHTIFRTGGFSISWQLVSLVFREWQQCTTLNSNANNQQNRDASSRPLEPNTHMHVNLQTTAMSDLLWCSVTSQDIIVQCSENKKL